MILVTKLRDQILLALKWSADEAHRRFITGAVVGGLGYFLHKEVDSTFVDCVVALAIPALTAAWSRHTPDIEVPAS